MKLSFGNNFALIAANGQSALENARIHCPALFLQDACDQILERFSPVIKSSAPDTDWESWVKTAYGQRINLSAQGFYTGPNTQFNWDTGIAEERYHYFVYGAACSEVEVDCLTGEFSVLRTDIVSDVGDSINPAIDIGQVSFLPYWRSERSHSQVIKIKICGI